MQATTDEDPGKPPGARARNPGRIALTLLALILPGCGGPITPEGPPPSSITVVRGADGITTIANVRVVDPSARTVTPGRTISMENGSIVAVDERGVGGGGTVVSAEGDVYALPGLRDMHVHLFDRNDLWLYLANGVTLVRNLSGTVTHLAWKDSIEAGHLIGPRLLTSGPILDGDPPARRTNTVIRTPNEADAEVRRQASVGYDLIKIYDNVATDVYAQILASARTAGMRVSGHLPTPVGLARMEAGPDRQDGLQHAEELFPYTFTTESTAREVGERLAAAGVDLTPTVAVMESALRQAREGASVLDDPSVAYVSRRIRDLFVWDATVAERAAQPGAEAGFQARLTAAQEIAFETHRAGGRLLVGTDAPIPTLVPGFAIHDELRLLTEAGIDVWDVLVAATSAAADAIGEPGEGRIAEGARGDLLLLSGDPTEDINHTRQILAVVRGGRVFTAQELAERLELIADENRSLR